MNSDKSLGKYRTLRCSCGTARLFYPDARGWKRVRESGWTLTWLARWRCGPCSELRGSVPLLADIRDAVAAAALICILVWAGYYTAVFIGRL